MNKNKQYSNVQKKSGTGKTPQRWCSWLQSTKQEWIDASNIQPTPFFFIKEEEEEEKSKNQKKAKENKKNQKKQRKMNPRPPGYVIKKQKIIGNFL